MKAALATACGGPDVIRIAEAPTPAPKPNEVLIRIHASAVNAADLQSLADPWLSKEIRAVIDSTFPLERISEAHTRAESGRKVGSVVITMT